MAATGCGGGGAGSTASSPDETLRVSTSLCNKKNCPPPTISFTAPASGATVSGTITVAGTASGSVALSSVAVSIDGGPYAAASGLATWSYSVDTTALGDGAHSAQAVVTDAKGNSGNASLSFTVSNGAATTSTPPTIAISAPTAGATVTGSIVVSGTSADAQGVSSVAVKLDSGSFQPAAGTTSWSYALDTAGLSNGAHTLTARATDGAGVYAEASVSLTVSNPTSDTTPPTVAIASPTSGATVGGFLAVAGTAADNLALAKVELQVDAGAFQVATGTGSWSASVDTRAFADGAHTLTARATDGAGNVKTTSVSVSFKNAVSAPLAVVITNPASGITLQGNVVVRGTATAPTSVARVEVRVDAGAWTLATGTGSWSSVFYSSGSPNGTHTIAARVTDSTGAQATSSVTVTFANVLPGSLGVAITSPSGSSQLSGPVTVTGTAGGATRLLVRVDALGWIPVPLLSSWSWTLDSSALSNGTHTLTVQAQDASGATVNATSSFATSNPDPAPTVAFLAPGQGATVSGLVLLRAFPYDLLSPVNVQFSVDGGAFGANPWLDTALLANGAHSVLARTIDAAGQATTATLSLNVAHQDVVKPTVRITAPAAGAAVSGTITISGTAADDVSVSRVDVKEGYGAYQPASGTGTWSYVLDTRGLANGSHDLIARAVDGAGNVSTALVTVTVANGASTDHLVTPEGVTIDVNSAGGWSAAAVYRMLKANAVALDVIGPTLKVVVSDTVTAEATWSSSTTEGRCVPGTATIYLNGASGVSALYPERVIAHEYGHVFAGYYLCTAQQLDWSQYFAYRGLAAEPRLDSVYPTWSRDEMIAEDYRETFGTPAAMVREDAFTNTNLPYKSDLRGFFLNVWAVPR